MPVLRPALEAMAGLAAYGIRVFHERCRLRLSEAWWSAFAKTQSVIVVALELFEILDSSERQIRYARNHIDAWQRACDVKLWKTVCGRSHAVPLEQIAAMRAEVEKVRDFLNNKDLH